MSSQELNPPGLAPEVLALMREAVERGDGLYSFDPSAPEPELELVVKFPPQPLRQLAYQERMRRATGFQAVGRVKTAARTPRRRSVRTRPSKARAPDEPSPLPELEAVPLSRFRADVRRWLEGVA